MAPARTLNDDDRWLFAEGRHENLYEVMGCHLEEGGAWFRVWAPNAAAVSVVGDFNAWNPDHDPMKPHESGLWEGFVPDLGGGARYKYHIVSRLRGYTVDKADPFAVYAETPPQTASITWNLDYQWGDGDWMASRAGRNAEEAPISIYEMHLGSWRDHEAVSYRTVAERLADHLERTGFTHVELLPVMEHPYYGSWGYQITGYFAATSRYGTAEDLMFLIDRLHQRGFGVILDWVPSHFPSDEHGLVFFDGTHLYEHADPRLGLHPDWNSLIFNYDRPEVRSFLRSSAHFWLDRYHADGIRVDAVASMLYLDYSRREGEWIPNRYGGRENLGAIQFLRELNASVHRRFSGTPMIAEESTAWPKVSRPIEEGGLGFSFKWDMGWMNDTLSYLLLDPFFRSHVDNHRRLTFRALYGWSERYILPLSHDEVVHGKRSLLARQPGDEWRQFAGLRLLLGYQWAIPGKKLLFMGAEIGQPSEWSHETDVPWWLLDDPKHRGILQWVSHLNGLMRREAALHTLDHHPDGFQWVEADDNTRSVIAFLRKATGARPLLVAANFTPVPWEYYRLGVPQKGRWVELLNSDATQYGGSGIRALGDKHAEQVESHGFAQSLRLTLPPLGVVFLAPARKPKGVTR